MKKQRKNSEKTALFDVFRHFLPSVTAVNRKNVKKRRKNTKKHEKTHFFDLHLNSLVQSENGREKTAKKHEKTALFGTFLMVFLKKRRKNVKKRVFFATNLRRKTSPIVPEQFF